MQTIIRVREQVHSNYMGLHVTTGSLLTRDRLQDYARAVAGRSVPPDADARATALLAHSVQNQANVLAYIDGFFMIIGFAVIGMLLLMLLVRAPPARG